MGRSRLAGERSARKRERDRNADARLAHALLAVGEAAHAVGDIDDRLSAICKAMVDIVDCDRSSVFVLDDGHMVPTANHGNPPDIAERFGSVRFSARHPLFERILESDHPIHIPDAAATPELLSNELVKTARIRAIIAARVLTADAPIGVITAEFNETAAEFDDLDEIVASGLARIAALVLDEHYAKRRESELLEQIRWGSEHDDLTGLPNRRSLSGWFDRAAERFAPGQQIAVLLADLDRFKVVNDALGHAAGDELLLVVSRRLATELAAPSIDVCRFGGDEFVIVGAVRDLAEAERLAERLWRALEPPVVLSGGHSIRVTASVGIALTSVADLKPDVLLSDADAAMYVAKDERRGRSVFAALDHRPMVSHRFDLEVSLDRALTNHEIVPWFQPIVDIASGRWVAVEALARWAHPERGVLRPAEFLPSLIEMGLLRRLTSTILAQASDVLGRPELSDLGLFVNLSVADLDEGLPGRLRAFPDPDRLVVELTERDAVSQPSDVVAILERVRSDGVRVALDDFGTGYSSLGVLADLPLDLLKIDRSLIVGVQSPTAGEVFRATVRLAHALDLEVISEGIEVQGELDEISAADVRLAQGTLLCAPMPAAELVERAPAAARPPGGTDRYDRPT